MERFRFVLVTKGYRTAMQLMGRRVECPKMDALYYSKVKTVYASSEDTARHKIERMCNRKWKGFIILPKKDYTEEELQNA